MSEQEPEAAAFDSALDRPEGDEMDEATQEPGMTYGDPSVKALDDEPFDDART